MKDSEPAITAAGQTASLCLMKDAASGWKKYYLKPSPETRQNDIENTAYRIIARPAHKQKSPAPFPGQAILIVQAMNQPDIFTAAALWESLALAAQTSPVS